VCYNRQWGLTSIMSSILTVKPAIKPNIDEQLLNDELFLYDGDSDNAVHCLNSGAAMIWYLCDGTRTVAQIAAEIAAVAGRPEAEILEDVTATIDTFVQKDLLQS
jgi:hypothetical protein